MSVWAFSLLPLPSSGFYQLDKLFIGSLWRSSNQNCTVTVSYIKWNNFKLHFLKLQPFLLNKKIIYVCTRTKPPLQSLHFNKTHPITAPYLQQVCVLYQTQHTAAHESNDPRRQYISSDNLMRSYFSLGLRSSYLSASYWLHSTLLSVPQCDPSQDWFLLPKGSRAITKRREEVLQPATYSMSLSRIIYIKNDWAVRKVLKIPVGAVWCCYYHSAWYIKWTSSHVLCLCWFRMWLFNETWNC